LNKQDLEVLRGGDMQPLPFRDRSKSWSWWNVCCGWNRGWALSHFLSFGISAGGRRVIVIVNQFYLQYQLIPTVRRYWWWWVIILFLSHVSTLRICFELVSRHSLFDLGFERWPRISEEGLCCCHVLACEGDALPL
jgi:hypothetical protein